MATLTKLSASPNSIRYQLGGNAGAVVKTQTQLVADLADGSLKATLSKISTDAEWTALANNLRIAFRGVTAQFVAADNWVQSWGTGPRSLSLSFGQTGNAYNIDLFYRHSFVY